MHQLLLTWYERLRVAALADELFQASGIALESKLEQGLDEKGHVMQFSHTSDNQTLRIDWSAAFMLPDPREREMRFATPSLFLHLYFGEEGNKETFAQWGLQLTPRELVVDIIGDPTLPTVRELFDDWNQVFIAACVKMGIPFKSASSPELFSRGAYTYEADPELFLSLAKVAIDFYLKTQMN